MPTALSESLTTPPSAAGLSSCVKTENRPAHVRAGAGAGVQGATINSRMVEGAEEVGRALLVVNYTLATCHSRLLGRT